MNGGLWSVAYMLWLHPRPKWLCMSGLSPILYSKYIVHHNDHYKHTCSPVSLCIVHRHADFCSWVPQCQVWTLSWVHYCWTHTCRASSMSDKCGCPTRPKMGWQSESTSKSQSLSNNDVCLLVLIVTHAWHTYGSLYSASELIEIGEQ